MAKIRRNLGIPAGVVFQSAAPTAPHGYLICDGSEVLKSDYPELFASIGNTYGTPSNALNFVLPDYRGRFLRGYDGDAGVDPDKAGRTAIKPGAVTGNAVGSIQNDATKRPNTAFATSSTGSHQHLMPNQGSSSSNSTGGGGGTFNGAGTTYWTDPAGAHTHSITGGGDNESRPTNVTVNYIIKY